MVKNIEGESTKANDLSHILWKLVCWVNNSQMFQCFHKLVTLQEAFETAQINEKLI